MTLLTSSRERLAPALYAALTGIVLLSLALGAWAVRVQVSLGEELRRAADSHAEVLVRDFTDRFWLDYDEMVLGVFESVSPSLRDPAALADTVARRVAARLACRCGPALEADGTFAWSSANGGEMAVRGVPPERARALRDKIEFVADSLPGAQSRTVVFKADLLGNELFVIARVRRSAPGGATEIFGFEGRLASLQRELVVPIAREVTRLRFGDHSEGIVAWRVLRPSGYPLYSAGTFDASRPFARHRLWARSFVLDVKDVREDLLGPSRPWAEGALPRPGADPRTAPYLVAVQVHPEGLANVLYGPVGLRQLTIGALLAATLLLCAVSLLFTRRFVRHLREREAFASAVAHDLRTPLTQILLYAETLQLDRPTPGARRDAPRVIVRETRRLIHLVENALCFSRGPSATPRLHIAATAPATVVRDALDSFRPMLERSDVQVERAFDDELRVRADADALAQVLGNVLDNALRYGPRGQTLRVAVVRSGSSAAITVEDEGPGVPVRDRERVFQPFARGELSGGIGIGLAVARQLIELMEGSIRIEHGTRGGARVVITLPLVIPVAPPHPTAHTRQLERTTT